MELCSALIGAEVQLAWGSNQSQLERALEHLVACSPRDTLVQALQIKLIVLRLAAELMAHNG
jgi:hypothetical protein